MVRTSSASLLAVASLVCGATASQVGTSVKPVERYKFVENTDRWVGVVRGEAHLIGKLDKNGDFTHEIKLKKGQPWSAGIPQHDLLNGGLNPKKVYEFRSGVLVPGELRKDKTFAAEVGGKIIAFADYTYTPEATPIWNLPGVFVPEKLLEPKK